MDHNLITQENIPFLWINLNPIHQRIHGLSVPTMLYEYNLGSYWRHSFNFCYGTSNSLVFPFEVNYDPSIEQSWTNLN